MEKPEPRAPRVAAPQKRRGVLPASGRPLLLLRPGGPRAGTPRAFAESHPQRHRSRPPKVEANLAGHRDAAHAHGRDARRGRTLRTWCRVKRAGHQTGTCVMIPRVQDAWDRRDGGEVGGRCRWGAGSCFLGQSSRVGGRESSGTGGGGGHAATDVLHATEEDTSKWVRRCILSCAFYHS